MPEPGYTSKNQPICLWCEVCGVKKDCVPCGNYRWCRQGRCPLCFPTILKLHEKPGVTMLKQQEAYKKIWDMQFWCETCSSTSSRKPPILKDTLPFKSGHVPERLQGCRSFYMCRDGTLLDQGEFASWQEQQRPAQAAPSPQAPKPQRPQSAPTQQPKQQPRPQQRPASAQQQQQRLQDQPTDKHKARQVSTERSVSPAAAATGAALAGTGPVKAKRLSDAGEQPRKRLKTTAAAAAEGRPKAPVQPQQQAQSRANAAAAGAAAAAPSGLDDDDDSGELNDEAVPRKQPGTKKAPAGAAPAAPTPSPGGATKVPAQAKSAAPPAAKPSAAAGQVPPPAAAQPALATQHRLANGQHDAAAAAAGSHRAAAPHAATATAAARLAVKQGSQQTPSKQRNESNTTGSLGAAAVPVRAAGAAAAAAGSGKAPAQQAKAPALPGAAAAVPRKRRSPQPSSGEGDSESIDESDDSSSGDKPVVQLLLAKKTAAAAASKAKGVAAAQQQQPTAKVPAQQQQQEQQQQQQAKAKVSAQQQQQQQVKAKVPTQQQQQQGQAKVPVQQGQQQHDKPKQLLQPAVPQQQRRDAAAPARPHAPVGKAAVGTAASKQDGRQAASSKQVLAAAASRNQQAAHKQQQAAAAKHAQDSDSEVSAEDDSSQRESSALENESAAAAAAGSSGGEDKRYRAGPVGAAGKQQQQAAMQKTTGHQAQQQAAQPLQGTKQPEGRKLPPGPPAIRTSAAKAAANGPAAPPAAAAGSCEGAAAGKDLASPKAARRVTFAPMDLEVVTDQPAAAAAAAHEARPAADIAARPTSSIAAAAADVVPAPSVARRPRSISRRTSALWPINCRVEAAGPTFRYEFSVQVKAADSRINVQVPPVLERLRGGTLHCMFWSKEMMLECIRSDGRGVDFEAVFDQPTPMTMEEVRFHEPTLPTVVKYMAQQRCYLRVWSDNGSLFFGPVLKGGHVADLDDRATTHPSSDQVEQRVLGLVMFKDSREAAPPEVYGRLTNDNMQLLEDEAPTPTTRAELAAASLHDESFLGDVAMDFFYDDEVFASYQALARGLPVLEQQQLRELLAAGMNRELLQSRPPRKKRRVLIAPGQPSLDAAASAAATAAGPGSGAAPGADGILAEPGSVGAEPEQQQGRADEEDEEDDLLKGIDVETEPDASPVEAGLQDMEQDHEMQQQQQQQQDKQGHAGHLQQEQGHHAPHPQQQPQEQPQEQQQGQVQSPDEDSRSPVAKLLEGGQPVREMMPLPSKLTHRLKTRGISGLVLYLDPVSFQLKDSRTAKLIKRARARGVVVHEPHGPAPPAASVDVLVVSNNHMDKCALEVSISPVQITDYLVSGVMVVSEVFLMELVEMKGAQLQLPAEPASPDYLLNQEVMAAFFQSGVALLLDVTLLLTTGFAELFTFLQQLRALKPHMPDNAQLLAFVQEPDLREAAQQHLQSSERWQEYLHYISGPDKLCRVMPTRYISSKREPAGTHMLRNAHKVSYNYNKRAHTQADRLLPLRYTVVVTTDDAAALPEQRRRDVAALLDNSDSWHKTVIGATMRQAQHLLSVIAQELKPSPR